MHYYLYECSSFYDKEKKKTRKKTGAYLGMVTEEKGLVPPRRRQVEIENEKLDEETGQGKVSVSEPRLGHVNEYGLSSLITTQCAELTENLRATMPTGNRLSSPR